MAEITINKGDTLGALAKQHGTTVQALQASNPSITNPDLIFAGNKLNIPGGSSNLPPVSTTGDASRLNEGSPTITLATEKDPGSSAELTSLANSSIPLEDKEAPEPTFKEQFEARVASTLGDDKAPVDPSVFRREQEESAGLATKEQLVNDLTAQLNAINAEATAAALKREEQPILGDIVGGQQRRIERDRAIRALPIAAQLSAAQGNLQLAQTQIERALTEKKEFDTDTRNFRLQQLNAIKGLADAEETERIRKEERQLKKEEKESDRLFNLQNTFAKTALENGQTELMAELLDPNASAEDILSAASRIKTGNTLDDQYKRLQIKKLQSDMSVSSTIKVDPYGREFVDSKTASTLNKEIPKSDAFKSIVKAETSLAQLTNFEELFKEVGTTSGVTSPFDNARLKARYNAAVLDLKEFFNLGVLNGPDLEVIQSVLPNPTSQGFITNITAKTATKEGLKNIKSMINTTLDDRYQTLALAYEDISPESVGALRDVQEKYIKNKSIVDPNIASTVEQMRKEFPGISNDDIIQVISTK